MGSSVFDETPYLQSNEEGTFSDLFTNLANILGLFVCPLTP